MKTQQSGFYLEVLEIQNWVYFLLIHLEGVPLLLGILNHVGLKDGNNLVLLQLLLTLLVIGETQHTMILEVHSSQSASFLSSFHNPGKVPKAL